MSAAQYAREALERAEKATEGDWHVHMMDSLFVGPGTLGNLSRVVHSSSDRMGALTRSAAEREFADAEFIAAARSDVPKLARAVMAVLERCDRAEAWNFAQDRPTTIPVSTIRRALSDALEVEA